ncbi:MAG: AIM24 family protein, partial [Actinomycetota bacterium]|nr:AIM24 family protein [Actinomycetota bacterium]
MAQLTAEGRALVADLHGDTVRAATGSMVAFTGAVQFSAAGMGGGDGFRAALKRKVAGESLSLMECTG